MDQLARGSAHRARRDGAQVEPGARHRQLKPADPSGFDGRRSPASECTEYPAVALYLGQLLVAGSQHRQQLGHYRLVAALGRGERMEDADLSRLRTPKVESNHADSVADLADRNPFFRCRYRLKSMRLGVTCVMEVSKERLGAAVRFKPAPEIAGAGSAMNHTFYHRQRGSSARPLLLVNRRGVMHRREGCRSFAKRASPFRIAAASISVPLPGISGPYQNLRLNFERSAMSAIVGQNIVLATSCAARASQSGSVAGPRKSITSFAS